MSIIDELEAEVSAQAGQMTVEVVLLLIDRWEAKIEEEWRAGKLTIPTLLNHYVRLKISLHHVRKAWDRGWSLANDDQIAERVHRLSGLIKEARRKYYVTKQRYDESDKHGSDCSCRGCNCIAGIDGRSSRPAGQSAN